VRITRGDGKYYEAGLHGQGAASLQVNRGIGMEGGAVPRVRFNCRPEITLFELRPGKLRRARMCGHGAGRKIAWVILWKLERLEDGIVVAAPLKTYFRVWLKRGFRPRVS
jgi:hypothetical protein